MAPTISVIIPAHNEEQYIRQTLHALKLQTFQNFETIIVANGCTDKTEEVISQRVNEHLQLLKMSKASVSRARNYGASKANGRLLVFLDADTLLEPESLQVINSQFKDEHAVATTKVKADCVEAKFRLLMAVKNLANQTSLYRGWISGVLICRKKDFDAVNGYDHQREVREQRNLILKLLKIGGYAHLDTYATTSMRRFQRWGLARTAGFWLKQLAVDHFGDISSSKYEKVR
ncbi:MAG TPA: glycosyltransferase [Candidatus Nanoarchaeia archaeon]|nr:glycosyltransferase [Candidatus Nanoarchaeia archaeon]